RCPPWGRENPPAPTTGLSASVAQRLLDSAGSCPHWHASPPNCRQRNTNMKPAPCQRTLPYHPFRPRVERLEDRTVPSLMPLSGDMQLNQAAPNSGPAIAAASDGHYSAVYITSSLVTTARLFNPDPEGN